MENYYTKYALVEQNGNHKSTKSNVNKNKNFYKTNVNINLQTNNKSTYFERGPWHIKACKMMLFLIEIKRLKMNTIKLLF